MPANLLSDHFIGHFLHKNLLILTMDIENDVIG